ncbi:MAG: hypothetical protein ABSG90_07020 [Dehalococcoidia bacterium]|jgi:hypothetical protein
MMRFWVLILALLLITSGCIYLPAGSLGGAGGSPTISSFSASPTTISAGGVATLNWSVAGATSVVIDQGIGNVAISGSRAVSPLTNIIYTLTASNGTASTTATTSVFVNGSPGGIPSGPGLPSIINFSANPPIVTPGGSSTLNWQVSDAASVAITPGIGNVRLSGSTHVGPTSSKTYTLTATNAAGTVTATTTIMVQSGSAIQPPIVLSFTANPAGIINGTPSILTWNIFGATSVSIDQGIGNVGASGSTPVHPGSSTIYTLTASNSAGGVTATTDINVLTVTQLPVIQYFTLNPSTIFKGNSTTLSWQTSGATQVLLNGSPVATNGHMVISPPSSQSYTLSVSNGFGNGYKTISLTVLILQSNQFRQLLVLPQL